MSVSSRERVAAALAHREPDRTPIFEYVLLPPVAEALLGRSFVEYAGGDARWPTLVAEVGWHGAIERYVADRLDLAAVLGHDLLYVVPNPPPEVGAAPSGASVAAAPAPDDPVERVLRRTEAGEQATLGVSEASLLVYVAIREEMVARGMDLPILAPAYAHGIWTDTDLMQTMLLAPEVARRHFALATRRALALIEAYVGLGIEQVGVGGDFAGNRLLISPQAYHDFIVPEVRTLSRRLHAAGRHAINASDGNLWPVIEDFLLGCEVDGYLEIDMNAGMDLGRLKQAYGDRITLYGNMDCGSVLSFCSPNEVARYTRECLEAGLGSGGHVFCCSNAITGSVPVANYVAMVNAYRAMFGLAKLAR